jgi:hypothetical protein
LIGLDQHWMFFGSIGWFGCIGFALTSINNLNKKFEKEKFLDYKK